MATTFNSINGFSFGELGTTVIDSNGNVISNALSASGNATFTSAATSTSTTTGAVKVTGGVGITGNIYVGGNLNVAAKSNLGAVGNVIITGGTSAYVLSTDGLGNLSWVAQTGGGGGGASISNGTSNVNIASVNGNVTVGVSGNANIVKFTGTGVNVAGTLQVTGVSNLGPVGNVVITGGSNGQMLTTDGSGNLTWTSSSSGNITIDTFTGNGVQTIFTLSTTPTSNNFIQVNIDGVTQLHNAFTVSSANVTMSAAPSSGAQVEVTTFVLGGGGGSGTFITRTYTGNGVQTTFTVTSGVTVDSVLVMENGIVQVPTTDYTVSGAVLTFTTAPAVAMGIQIRELASGGSPAGSNTYIQFNNAGSFGGTANLTWDGANFRVNTTTIKLGANAGLTSQGANSIAIGANAGVTSQAANSIIINATGATLNQTTANTFTVAPIRNDTSNVANVLYYNTSTKEISYAPQGGITAQDLLSPFLLMGA